MTTADDDRAVLRYLAAVEAGRTATEELPQPDDAAAALAGADMVTGADRAGLETQLGKQILGSEANVASMEDEFVRAAAGYAERHTITYEGWLTSGVAPQVLERAGIRPSGG